LYWHDVEKQTNKQTDTKQIYITTKAYIVIYQLINSLIHNAILC